MACFIAVLFVTYNASLVGFIQLVCVTNISTISGDKVCKFCGDMGGGEGGKERGRCMWGYVYGAGVSGWVGVCWGSTMGGVCVCKENDRFPLQLQILDLSFFSH